MAAERGTIIYLWYSTFFCFLDLGGCWFVFFFSHLGFFLFSSLPTKLLSAFSPFSVLPQQVLHWSRESALFFSRVFFFLSFILLLHLFFIVVVACKWQFSCRYAYAQRVVETTTFAIPATFKLHSLVCRGVLLSVPSSSFPKSNGTSRISETKTNKQGEREEEEKNGVIFFLSHKCVGTIVEEQYSRCFRWQIVSATCRNPVHRTSFFFCSRWLSFFF